MKSMRYTKLLVLALTASTCAFQPTRSKSFQVRPVNQPPVKIPLSLHELSKSRPDISLNLNPTTVLSSISSPLGSLSVLAFVILIHEAGHFIAARSFGIDVDEFSVGVGPRILGVKKRFIDDKVSWEWIEDLNGEEEGDVQKNDGSIDFSLRALPLGGYVRFPPSYNQTLAFEVEDKARISRNEARLLRVEKSTRLEKTLEFLAAKSFVFNMLSLGLLKKWAKAREELQLKDAEEEVLLEQKNRSNGNKSWWEALPWNSNEDNGPESDSYADSAQSKLDLIKAGQSPEIEYYDNPNLLQNRPWQQRAVVLAGGVAFNILLAFMCYFGEVTVGKGLPKPYFDSGAVVSGIVATESPAFGKLKKGDIILGVNGKKHIICSYCIIVLR